jgi:hypothetical protein
MTAMAPLWEMIESLPGTGPRLLRDTKKLSSPFSGYTPGVQSVMQCRIALFLLKYAAACRRSASHKPG